MSPTTPEPKVCFRCLKPLRPITISGKERLGVAHWNFSSAAVRFHINCIRGVTTWWRMHDEQKNEHQRKYDEAVTTFQVDKPPEPG